ncbi:MAG: hypothetical protein IJP35_03920, partial [Clostridia bacterium]|nr:hypothetical protein [Clostridia bacterium]
FIVGAGVPDRPWVAHKTKLSLRGEAVAIRNTRKRKIRILHSVQNDTLIAKQAFFGKTPPIASPCQGRWHGDAVTEG